MRISIITLQQNLTCLDTDTFTNMWCKWGLWAKGKLGIGSINLIANLYSISYLEWDLKPFLYLILYNTTWTEPIQDLEFFKNLDFFQLYTNTQHWFKNVRTS